MTVNKRSRLTRTDSRSLLLSDSSTGLHISYRCPCLGHTVGVRGHMTHPAPDFFGEGLGPAPFFVPVFLE